MGEELLACSPPEGSWGAWVGSAAHRGPAQSWCREDCSGLSLGLSFPVCTVRAEGLRQGLSDPWEFGRVSLVPGVP